MSELKTAVINLLQPYRNLIGKDYELYQNHVCRVVALCLLLDPDKQNEDKYLVAAAFHDIGIWTAGTFDYIDPSIEAVGNYLQQSNSQLNTEEISSMIQWHHKISSYKDKYNKTVNVFRKADWIDVTFGLRSFGVKRSELSKLKKEFPDKTFHRFLLSMATRNFFKHPLAPLPMFRF